MKKYGELLERICQSFFLLMVSVGGFSLFFLWFPDFMSWLSAKMTLVAEGTIVYTILSLLPLSIVIGAVFLLAFLAMSSLISLGGKTEETITA